jgi:hypothetical protein
MSARNRPTEAGRALGQDLLAQPRRDALVRVEGQHPVVRGGVERRVAAGHEPGPGTALHHACAGRFGDRARAVVRAPVHDQDLVAEADAVERAGEVLFFVEGDDDRGERDHSAAV